MSESGRMELSFTPEHAALFSALSGDRNPLHLDPGYARRTPYGRPVLFGVAAVLAALGAWAGGRRFRLSGLRAVFDQPLFTGIGYTLAWTGQDGRVELKLLKGSQVRTRISFRWEAPGAPGQPAAPVPFQPLAAARERAAADLPATLEDYPYAPDWSQAGPFQERFGLGPDQWPPAQLAALLFASYFIGMDCPGRQALFAELKISFHGTAAFRPGNLALSYHPGFSLLEVAGSGATAFTLKAFLRPGPVLHPLAEVRAEVGASAAMAGRKVLVTGASRGFGAVLAKALALQGAEVGLNYRSGHAEAEAVLAELGPGPGRALLLPGDLGRSADCARVALAAAAGLGSLDLLVCNASPAIEARPFLAQTAAECLGFVQDSLAMLVGPLRELLPGLKPGATVVYVSSAYVRSPQAQFSHYLAAKGAAEGLVRGLAEEFRHLRFIIFRPPRMLTDQTSAPFDPDPGVSAITVAKQLLEVLMRAKTDSGLTELG
jgi:NAD(P)-dependent dehydrogenase (short-subunit alcohol dehydrogenase family)